MIYSQSCPVIVEAGEMNVTSPFGWRTIGGVKEFHYGVDLTRWVGWSTLATICAIEEGTVCKVGYDPSRGNNVSVDHGNGVVTMYFHLAEGSIRVKPGDHISKKQNVGYMGNTGNSSGAHLHFQIEINGVAVDGLPYLTGEKKIKEDDMLTYEQFCEYMARYEKEKAALPASPWAEESLEWAVRNGILRGDESGNLMPQANLTREQMAVIFNRYAERSIRGEVTCP